MKVGDIVKHKYGTLVGAGVVLNLRKADGGRARVAWTALTVRLRCMMWQPFFWRW